MKNRKRKIPWAPIFGLLFLALVIGAAVYEVTRPIDPLCTVSSIQDKVQSGGVSARVDAAYYNGQDKALLAETSKTYYDVDCSDEFAALFSFDAWEKASAPSGSPSFSLLLGEWWQINFYSDGRVEAYDGYGGLHEKNIVYYKMPESGVTQIMEYLTANGTKTVPRPSSYVH